MKVNLISLGCPKNLVDSEVILGFLQRAGFTITLDQTEAEVVVINTCGFIEDARQESIETILEIAEQKKHGQVKLLVVTGCLAQGLKEELGHRIPEIDLVIGTGMIPQAGSLCQDALKNKLTQAIWVNDPTYLYTEHTPRFRATLPHVAYVKIAEGCDNRCSYCLIPSLRGRYRSRQADSVVSECEGLVADGVKEINLIAQDTTAYGQDLPREGDKLVPLLRRLAKIDGLRWIRLLYVYPDLISTQLLECLAEEPKICKYIDLPIQHINDRILQAMNRKSNRCRIEQTITLIRRFLPGAVLRTSLMVGFPGESQGEFRELADFVTEARFDRLGVFVFSSQKGTPAARMREKIPRRIKEQRRDEILNIQALISAEKNQQLVGRIQEVIIDALFEPNQGSSIMAIGRTAGQAPDIDGLVYLSGNNGLSNNGFSPGEIQRIRITQAEVYDLFGVNVLSPSSDQVGGKGEVGWKK